MFLLRLSGIFCIYTRLDFCISIQFSNTVVTVRNESRELWNIWCTFVVVHVMLCDSLLQWLRVLYFSPRWYLQNLPSSSFCFGYWVVSCWEPLTLYYNMIVWLMSEGGTENPGFCYWLVSFNNILEKGHEMVIVQHIAIKRLHINLKSLHNVSSTSLEFKTFTFLYLSSVALLGGNLLTLTWFPFNVFPVTSRIFASPSEKALLH